MVWYLIIIEFICTCVFMHAYTFLLMCLDWAISPVFTCTDLHCAGNVHRAVFEVGAWCLLCDFPPCFWGRVYHWTQCSPIWLDWLVSESQDPPVSTFLALGSKTSVIVSGFYVGARDWTQVLRLTWQPHYPWSHFTSPQDLILTRRSNYKSDLYDWRQSMETSLGGNGKSVLNKDRASVW